MGTSVKLACAAILAVALYGCAGSSASGNAETKVHRAPEIGQRVAGIADRPIDIGAFERGDGGGPKEAGRIKRSQLQRFVDLPREVVAADPDLEDSFARRTLALRQADPDFGGMRDSSALAKLSTLERNDCLALWNEVASVLDRARDNL